MMFQMLGLLPSSDKRSRPAVLGPLDRADVLLDHHHLVDTTQYFCMTAEKSVSETCLHQK